MYFRISAKLLLFTRILPKNTTSGATNRLFSFQASTCCTGMATCRQEASSNVKDINKKSKYSIIKSS
jgi:hypothetical protein